MATTDDAVIRLRLDTSQAEADLKRFEGSATGVTVRARTIGQQGGSSWSPGGGGMGGGGIMGMLGGMGMGGLGVAGLAGMFAAPMAGDLAGGLNGVLGGAGRDLSSALGFSRFNRWSKERGAATDMTLSQLGGAPATREQTLALRDINAQILGYKNKNTSDQEQWIGEKGTEDFLSRIATATEIMANAATHPNEVYTGMMAAGSQLVNGMKDMARNLLK